VHDTDLGCPTLCNQPGDISPEHVYLTGTCGESNGFWRVNLKAVVHLKDLVRNGKKTAIYTLNTLDAGLLARNQYRKVLRPATSTQVFLGFPVSISKC